MWPKPVIDFRPSAAYINKVQKAICHEVGVIEKLGLQSMFVDMNKNLPAKYRRRAGHLRGVQVRSEAVGQRAWILLPRWDSKSELVSADDLPCGGQQM